MSADTYEATYFTLSGGRTVKNDGRGDAWVIDIDEAAEIAEALQAAAWGQGAAAAIAWWQANGPDMPDNPYRTTGDSKGRSSR